MTQLYLVRHGESEGNKSRHFLGNTDLDLSPLGYRQAERTAQYLRNIHIDAVYSSPLRRAYHTAEPIAKIQKLPIIVDDGLREIKAGKWENRSYDDIARLYEKEYSRWLNDIGNARCTDGESVAELQERAKATVFRIVSKHPDQTICIATHAAFIRTLMCHWKGRPLAEMKDIPWVGNSSVSHIEFDHPSCGIIIEENHTEHLGELASFFAKNI